MKKKSSSGILYLIPAPLWEHEVSGISQAVREITLSLSLFAVEEIRTTRRYLRSLDKTFDIDGSQFFEMDKHGKYGIDQQFLKEIANGKNGGIISEAGCPCVADPGYNIVYEAHQMGITVKPLTGPNSILLALMASGFYGQKYHFHGYLPIEKEKRMKALKGFSDMTNPVPQIFIETPFRNQPMLEDIIRFSHPEIELCIAAELTSPHEFIGTKTIKEWSKNLPDLHKKPVVFIINPKRKQ